MTPRRPAPIVAELLSDGSLAGTVVRLAGIELEHVVAVDLRIDAAGATLHVRVGRTVTDYGAPAVVDVTGARASLEPSPSPRE